MDSWKEQNTFPAKFEEEEELKIPVVSSFLLKVMKKKKVEKKHDEQVDEGNRKSIE